MADLYVITGGVCVGKTSVINMLVENKFYVILEAAERVIREEIKSKKPEKEKLVPWNVDKRQELQKRIFDMQSEDIKNIKPDIETVLLDRSYIDNAAFCDYYNIAPVEGLIDAINSSNYKKAYILEQLPSRFYVKTEIRHEDEKEADLILKKITETYMKYLPAEKIVRVPAVIKTQVTDQNDVYQLERATRERMFYILKDAKGIKQ